MTELCDATFADLPIARFTLLFPRDRRQSALTAMPHLLSSSLLLLFPGESTSIALCT